MYIFSDVQIKAKINSQIPVLFSLEPRVLALILKYVTIPAPLSPSVVRIVP